MNLLSSLSILNLAANGQENWQIVARKPESQALALGNLANAPMCVEIGGNVRENNGGELDGKLDGEVDGKIEDSEILLNDTIVSYLADLSSTLDRFFGLSTGQNFIRQNSIHQIVSAIKDYGHHSENEKLFVTLFVTLLMGLNPQQPSGRYGLRPTVPN